MCTSRPIAPPSRVLGTYDNPLHRGSLGGGAQQGARKCAPPALLRGCCNLGVTPMQGGVSAYLIAVSDAPMEIPVDA